MVEKVSGRRARETTRARAGYDCYVKLGPERSLQGVAHELGVQIGTVKYWSRHHRWEERLLEEADRIAEAQREAAKEVAKTEVKQEAERWRERQESHRKEEWALREELLGMAREAIRRWYDTDDRPPTPDSIVRLVELISRLGRLASGLGTDRTEITGPDGSILQIEIKAALARVYGVAEGPVIEVGGKSEIAKAEIGKAEIEGS